MATVRARDATSYNVSHDHRASGVPPLSARPSAAAHPRLPASESAGGILLLASAVAALAWANSPWGQSYGLEIKREVLFGELTSLRRASLPFAAALGGMVASALIYAAINAGRPGAAGWATPMATDIAFAVGVLALVGRAVPTSVKVFLLAIAIVDDLGAVLVIALFYTSDLSTTSLAVAGGFLVALVLLNILRVHRPLPYMLLGVGLWAATLLSGVHATTAGVLLAFTIPATRRIDEQPYIEYVREKLAEFERDTEVAPDEITENQSHALHAMREASQAVQTPLARVEHALLRPVTVVIVPLFALANAGVNVRSAGGLQLGSPTMWGVLLGLLVGKPLGVLLASWLAIKTGVAALPEGGTWRQVVGVSFLCGIGFTMSLFIGTLAFDGRDDQLVATKVGILLASFAAGLVGSAIIVTAGNRMSGVEPSDDRNVTRRGEVTMSADAPDPGKVFD